MLFSAETDCVKSEVSDFFYYTISKIFKFLNANNLCVTCGSWNLITGGLRIYVISYRRWCMITCYIFFFLSAFIHDWFILLVTSTPWCPDSVDFATVLTYFCLNFFSVKNAKPAGEFNYIRLCKLILQSRSHNI